MKVSSDCVAIIRRYGLCNLNAQPIPGRKGEWAIGWGSTGVEVRRGLSWTQEQADAALAADVAEIGRAVERMLRAPVTQGQFDALVSLASSIGLPTLRMSTLLLKVNRGDADGAAKEFGVWARAGGRALIFRKRRRAAEAALFGGLPASAAIDAAEKVQE